MTTWRVVKRRPYYAFQNQPFKKRDLKLPLQVVSRACDILYFELSIVSSQSYRNCSSKNIQLFIASRALFVRYGDNTYNQLLESAFCILLFS